MGQFKYDEVLCIKEYYCKEGDRTCREGDRYLLHQTVLSDSVVVYYIFTTYMYYMFETIDINFRKKYFMTSAELRESKINDIVL